MSQNNGVHGESGATEDRNIDGANQAASTDASLNARAKSSNRNNGGPKWWLWTLIAVVVAAALIVGVTVFGGKGKGKDAKRLRLGQPIRHRGRRPQTRPGQS